MKRFKFCPVTITREEYDDYIKAKFLVQHLLQCVLIDSNGIPAPYTRIKTEVIAEYYPEEIEKIRRGFDEKAIE